MFYVEHMKKYLILAPFLIVLGFLSLSCEKKNPAPELEDLIYMDLKQELDISTKQEADIAKQVLVDTQNYKKVLPQSGQSTPLRNKMSGSENLLEIVRQQKKYFEIKLEQRRRYVRQRYLESFKEGGRPWPDTKEIDDYRVRMKLQRSKFTKDAEAVPRGTSDTKHTSKADKKEKSKK